MKTFKLFSMAAVALMMAACSSEDIMTQQEPAKQGGLVHFTATLAAPTDGVMRTAYTEVTSGTDAGTIKVAWEVGDEILVMNIVDPKKRGTVKVKTVNSDGSATIEGVSSDFGNNGETVGLAYPSELDIWKDKGITQDGTLSYIADNMDVRVGFGTLKVDGDKATLVDDVKMQSGIAIWKLTLQNNDATPAALSASQVSIKVGDQIEASTTTLTTATSTVYLALQPFDGKDITINAITADGYHTYSKTGVTLEAGKYYQSTVQLAQTHEINIADLCNDYTAQNGDILSGKLSNNVSISIADGATVTLDGVNINGDGGWNKGDYAGLTPLGDATIILKDGSENIVKGFNENYPGIFAADDKKLTIQGTGKLEASSNGSGAGIGGRYNTRCGDIEIQGGTITATGGTGGAGIGAGDGTYPYNSSCNNITITGGTIKATGGDGAAGIGSGGSCSSCGDITISGGTIEATGGNGAAGIGSGRNSSYVYCCDITITDGVTSVTATKGDGAPNSIGAGDGASCGTVTIGTQQMYNGTAWSPSPMVAGSYGGLNLAITTTTNTDDTWTLTPVTP